MFKLTRFVTGPLDVNTYVCYDDETKKCFIVDPSEWMYIKGYINEHHLCCTHILITHGHFDHILCVAKLKDDLNAKVCIHKDDAESLYTDKINLSVFCGIEMNGHCKADIILNDGDSIICAGKTIKVLHTPGHSKGSVCYIIEDEHIIFSGDTLFNMGIGRTDLYYSDSKALNNSIKKLYSLKDNYAVLPGHGEFTELSYEKINNPFTKDMV